MKTLTNTLTFCLLLLTFNSFSADRIYNVVNNEILTDEKICITTLTDSQANWTVHLVEDLYSCELYRFANNNNGQIEIDLEFFGLEPIEATEFNSQKLLDHPVYLISGE